MTRLTPIGLGTVQFGTDYGIVNTTGIVAQIGLGDSSSESSMIAGGYEQLGPYEVQDQELVYLQ